MRISIGYYITNCLGKDVFGNTFIEKEKQLINFLEWCVSHQPRIVFVKFFEDNDR